MTHHKDHSRTAESRSRSNTGKATNRRPGVLTDHPTSPRDNPSRDARRMALAREDWSRIVGK